MKTTFRCRAATTAARIFCLPGLVFASADSPRQPPSLSRPRPARTLGAALDVCYRVCSNWKFTLCCGPPGGLRLYNSFCSYSFASCLSVPREIYPACLANISLAQTSLAEKSCRIRCLERCLHNERFRAIRQDSTSLSDSIAIWFNLVEEGGSASRIKDRFSRRSLLAIFETTRRSPRDGPRRRTAGGLAIDSRVYTRGSRLALPRATQARRLIPAVRTLTWSFSEFPAGRPS